MALKVSANSLYGQCGSKYSPIGKRELAASTTAIGREMLKYARDFAEKHFNAVCVYGDTDSCFYYFPDHIKPEMTDKEKL